MIYVSLRPLSIHFNLPVEPRNSQILLESAIYLSLGEVSGAERDENSFLVSKNSKEICAMVI